MRRWCANIIIYFFLDFFFLSRVPSLQRLREFYEPAGTWIRSRFSTRTYKCSNRIDDGEKKSLTLKRRHGQTGFRRPRRSLFLKPPKDKAIWLLRKPPNCCPFYPTSKMGWQLVLMIGNLISIWGDDLKAHENFGNVCKVSWDVAPIWSELWYGRFSFSAEALRWGFQSLERPLPRCSGKDENRLPD